MRFFERANLAEREESNGSDRPKDAADHLVCLHLIFHLVVMRTAITMKTQVNIILD